MNDILETNKDGWSRTDIEDTLLAPLSAMESLKDLTATFYSCHKQPDVAVFGTLSAPRQLTRLAICGGGMSLACRLVSPGKAIKHLPEMSELRVLSVSNAEFTTSTEVQSHRLVPIFACQILYVFDEPFMRFPWSCS